VIAAISGPGALTDQGTYALEMRGEEGGKIEVIHRDPKANRNARLWARLDYPVFAQ
jgi:hypothetical protein